MRSRLLRLTLVWGLVVVFLIVLSYVFLDRPAAWAAHSLKSSGTFAFGKAVSMLANSTVVFALPAGGLILAALNLTGPAPKPWARDLLYFCLTVCAAVAMVEIVKFIFGRYRPVLLFNENRFGFTWFTDIGSLNSFPSGHTTRIFAMCTALALLFRRLAIPLFALAALVGVCRVLALKHYPSDVLAGAYLGITVAAWAHAVWRRREQAT